MAKTLPFFFLFLFGIQAISQVNPESIDAIVKQAVENDSFEGTVLIAENGEIVYHQAFGFKDENKKVPTSINARFGIASITKLFTAIIILQLVEEGKIQLSDSLNELLPAFKIPEGDRITVHHLLLHISGLPNENDAIYLAPTAPKEFVQKTLENESHTFGEFNYANIDYVLLGLIIEKIDQKTWENSVQKRILENLEMNETGFLDKGNYPDDFAYSFSFNKEGVRQADPLFFIENFYAAGCMYSTAEDLLKLDQGLYSSEILSNESKELMYKSYPEYNYSGYSVWTYNYPFSDSQPRLMERRGGILGANSVLIRMLDTNKTIIILSNNNKFNPDSFGNTNSLKEALIIEVDKAGT
ncbi:serine hydrolase domain-containing protein [Algoriphagus limi]|uniref:Beta-lactamase family protein n=1 Tax=Algoriphagus limi TaxID=2975273 RepID=A0ABT2G528_9BACT|nr:serine hydrolase domain-containing protein [Algoriphagus limi]MCS5490365.1 beta-lactamase family protein [Algoriphagus limi]